MHEEKAVADVFADFYKKLYQSNGQTQRAELAEEEVHGVEEQVLAVSRAEKQQ